MFTQTWPLDLAAAICESEAGPVAAAFVDVFFVEAGLAEDEPAVAGAAGVLAAGAEVDAGVAAFAFAPDDLLVAVEGFALSVAGVPESAAAELAALFFLLLLEPLVLVLADSLDAASPIGAPLVSDFLLFLALLWVELLLAGSELAELSEVAESDFFDFVLFFDEVESLVELLLLVALSELDFFFLDFLLLVEVVPWSADVPAWVS